MSEAMPHPPPVHVCIRQTLDWHDETLVNARLIPRFRPKFDVWNATLTMPYHVFRQRLKAIAELNFSRIEGAVCSQIDEVPSGHIIVPVDDDDWFAPDLVTHIHRAHERGATAYLWSRRTLQYESPIVSVRRRIARLMGRPEKAICKTNNYAVQSKDGMARLAVNHMHASEYFAAHPSDVRRIPATLAVQNRNLASQTALAWGHPTISPAQLVSLLKKHRALYQSWKHGAELPWTTPYVNQMAELMAEVDAR